MSTVLDQELDTYKLKLPELLAQCEGRFVLIKDSRVLGTFESQQDAIDCGYRELGIVPFLVKQVVAFETPVNFISPVSEA